MPTYYVWFDYGSEGWSPSEPLDTLEKAVECWKNHITNGEGRSLITRLIEPEFKDVPKKGERDERR